MSIGVLLENTGRLLMRVRMDKMNLFDKHMIWLTKQSNYICVPLFVLESYVFVGLLIFAGYKFISWLF